ncbi:hypothetical protein [Luteimonas sp. MC1572]|uniref:hypothetical protein n=1 Tax=Luteimonas sp. MC1572 TaxID=2799325 RepID=UPI0018F0B955|nr:hypothetical protein [Luteimonas sp. MC1572]MBJ6981313.1 hypothetical protein [Luteimonas sp. MC1572]QQO02631.1 hypothetical protein JGR64_10665 [Luteimonas sp. MC1572]
MPLMLPGVIPSSHPDAARDSTAAAARSRLHGGTRLRGGVVERLGLARRWQWWLIGSMLVVVLLAVLRAPLGGLLWPETRSQALRAEAARALAEGRLSAADGTGARELFEAALAMDPDRREASQGLAQVAAAALAQARVALAEDRLDDARAGLALARELSVPKAEAEQLEEALRRREAGHAGLDSLLAAAEAARLRGHLDGDDSAALPLYARVLAIEPAHADALRGREDALAELLGQAREALRRGELGAAAQRIDAARRFDGGHIDLPDTLARLTEETDAVRRRADNALARGRLDRALEGYNALLALDASDASAQDGVAAVASAHAAEASRLAADFAFVAAEAALARAQAIAPDAAGVAEAEARLERARQNSAQLATRLPAAERDRRVRQLLDAAEAARARGNLLSPPGESAFDKIARARALAPQSRAVRAASARLLPAARDCYERELRGNSLGQARACLDARAALGEDAGELAAARTRLAQRWLAVGNERLGAGEVERAQRALALARAIDPGVPGLDDFRQRLRAAGAPAD